MDPTAAKPTVNNFIRSKTMSRIGASGGERSDGLDAATPNNKK